MGDKVSDLRTRFLDAVDDPGAVQYSSNARIARWLSEGQRAAVGLIRARRPQWPTARKEYPMAADVEQYPLPGDFEEDIYAFRSDISYNPRLPKTSFLERESYLYWNGVLSGPVDDDGTIIPRQYGSTEVYYIQEPYMGILPIPTASSSAAHKIVLVYRQRVKDLVDDNDRAVVPYGAGSDVIVYHAAILALAPRQVKYDHINPLLAAASERLQAQFGWSANPDQPWLDAVIPGY